MGFALVVLASLQLATSAPFLDIKLPFLEIRREGKDIDDGYGAPQDSYGVPEDSYGAPQDTYEEPKPSYSTTVAPCGYKPTTTTTTEAPQYGAPRQQAPVFPDIFGIIGDILKPIHEKHNTPDDCLSAPEEGYGVPRPQLMKRQHKRATTKLLRRSHTKLLRLILTKPLRLILTKLLRLILTKPLRLILMKLHRQILTKLLKLQAIRIRGNVTK